VRIDGAISGRVTSGGYGHTVQRSIAYAWLPTGVDVGAECEVDIFGGWIAAEVAAEPLFDPSGERVRD
jgi:glycine cleavage system aminomethyltransferase T